MKFFELILSVSLLVSVQSYGGQVSSKEAPAKPTQEETERMLEKINSFLILEAAAAKDLSEAQTGLTRKVSVAVAVTEEMKTSGFTCFLTTWHMSGRMIQYKWSVRAEMVDSDFPFFRASISTALKTPKTITDSQGTVIETREDWELAESASQVARTLGDISVRGESIHRVIRTDSVRMEKPRYGGGLIIFPQKMSLQSGVNNLLSRGVPVENLEKVEVQKHPGFGSPNFPPSKPNEFQCFHWPR